MSRSRPSGPRSISAALLAPAAILLGLGGGCTVTIGERSFFPARPMPLPPMDEGVTRKNIEMVVEGGVTLRGWHLRRPGAQRVVVFFHGNGAGIVTSDWALHWLSSALDADVVALDHRGYGFSDGQASVDAIVKDALGVPTLLARLGLDARPLVVVGQSMGTAPAMHLAAAKPIAALVLISPFSSYEDLVSAIRRQAPWYARVVADASLTGLATSPLADLPKIKSPTLIVHGTRDELSTEDVVQRVEAVCGAPRKEVCRFVGTHNDANPTTPDVRSCIQRFFSAGSAP